MTIQNNMLAHGASRELLKNQLLVQHSVRQLASGYRINSAADDAAGLAISEKMRAQQTALERAIDNAHDGRNMVNTAEGALNELHHITNRLTDLSMQAANGILSDGDRAMLQNEAQSLLDEIDRIAQATTFNGLPLIDGSLASEAQIGADGIPIDKIADSLYIDGGTFEFYDGTNLDDALFTIGGETFALVQADDMIHFADELALNGAHAVAVNAADPAAMGRSDYETVADAINTAAGTAFEGLDQGMAMQVGGGIRLQVGITGNESDAVTVTAGDMSAEGLALDGIDLSTQQGALKALDVINTARERISSTRSGLGSVHNRLEAAISNLGVNYENITASESRLRDADMAKSWLELTRQNMLKQAKTSMLAQSNLHQQQVLQLLY